MAPPSGDATSAEGKAVRSSTSHRYRSLCAAIWCKWGNPVLRARQHALWSSAATTRWSSVQPSLGGAACGELSRLPRYEAPNELAQPMLFLVLRDETVRK